MIACANANIDAARGERLHGRGAAAKLLGFDFDPFGREIAVLLGGQKRKRPDGGLRHPDFDQDLSVRNAAA